MKLPLVRLRNKKTGKRLCINERDWAEDLGRGTWRGWERIGELHTGESKDVADFGEVAEATADHLEKVVAESPVLPPVDIEAAEDAAAKTLAEKAKETFIDRGGNEKPKRGRGRPRTVNIDKE